MGVNQSHEGVRVAQAIINLALMTGNIGRPGHRRELDHRPVQRDGLAAVQQHHEPARRPRLHERRASRARSRGILGIDAGRIPDRNSLAYDQILEGMLARQDPRRCGSSPRTPRTRGSTRTTSTTCSSGSISWSCRTCTRPPRPRVSRIWCCRRRAGARRTARSSTPSGASALIKRCARAPGQALADFYIFKLIAEAWGCGELFRRWTSPERPFRILKRAVARPALRYHRHRRLSMLERLGGIQWPLPEAASGRSTSASGGCSTDGRFFHADGKARFLFEEPRPVPEVASRRYPLTLLTGRGSSSQWHTQTRTEQVRRAAPDCTRRRAYVEISPSGRRSSSASRPDDWVIVESRRGDMIGRAPSYTHACSRGRCSCRCTTRA